MKYFVIFIILIGFTGFIIPQVFGTSENLFSGTTTFERLPITLSPNTEAKFEIKFQYTKGTYSLGNVTAIVDIIPQDATRFVHFNAEPFDVYQNSIARIPVTISIDPDMEYEKIFLNLSYVGTGTNDERFKSSWFDSLIFDIVPKINKSTELPSSEDYEFETLTGAICDGQVGSCYGTFYNGTTIPIQCDYRHSCGVIAFDNEAFYQPPLKQLKSGISFDKIQCYDDKVLVFKNSNGSPACVKAETKTKLIDRGWVKHTAISQRAILEGVQDSYEINETLRFTAILKSGEKCNSAEIEIVNVSTGYGHGIEIDSTCNSQYLSEDTRIDIPMGHNDMQVKMNESGTYKIILKVSGDILVEKEFVVKNQSEN